MNELRGPPHAAALVILDLRDIGLNLAELSKQ